MKVYGIKTCDSCRKVLKSLKSAELVDLRVDGIPSALLERAFAQFSDKLVNTRSTTWRNLDEDERKIPPLELLTMHPTLMKRPLIEADGVLYLGWGSDIKSALNVDVN